MPSFIADLHVHSYLSRATSRDCTLEGLYCWAQRKGIRVVGTGDCTHPGWFAELGAKLVPGAPGLYRLRADLAAALDASVPPACRAPVDFVVSGEISSIYKRDGQTRKVHSLILLPDLASAGRLNARLSTIGNLAADGRPILGLDPRDLLRLTLDAHAEALYIPAHIWTPWFSMLGSMSGFDSPEACFGDLVDQVFAVETGLSSDPPMNWRVSSLDRFSLVSNSDLHSPANLGRNASVFPGEPDYYGMRQALRSKTPERYGGTIDLFPEEGKYHCDGHRACKVCLEPEESLRLGGNCPVCGKPLVLGVLHRVVALADQPRGRRPPNAAAHEYIIPLPELLAEILGCGRGSRKVGTAYEGLLQRFGAELPLLREAPLTRFERAEPALLGEAIRRVRAGEVHRSPGYDGEYGVIRVFQPGEMDGLRRQGMLLRLAPGAAPPAPARRSSLPDPEGDRGVSYRLPAAPPAGPWQVQESGAAIPPLSDHEQAHGQLSLFATAGVLDGLDAQQRQAAAAAAGPLLIVAGPGTGKTRTLTHRIAHLVADLDAAPDSILAVTFTNRAAGELRERLRALLGERAQGLTSGTFHGLCLQWLRRWEPWSATACLIDEAQERDVLAEVTGMAAAELDRLQMHLAATRRGDPVSEPAPAELADWAACLEQRALLPLDEIIPRCLRRLRLDAATVASLPFRWLCVDEFQDLNPVQHQLVRAIAGEGGGLCVIGDPDQSIYGFRGSDPRGFAALAHGGGPGRLYRLSRNYRSAGTIVAAADAVIAPGRTELSVRTEAAAPGGLRVRLHAAPTVAAEAEFMAHEIERWLGGTALFSLDSGRVTGAAPGAAVSFGDIAVLVRLKALIPAYAEALGRLGVPVRSAAGGAGLDAPALRRLLAAARQAPRACLEQPLDAALAALGAERLLRPAERQAIATLAQTLPLPSPTLGALLEQVLLRVPGDEVEVHAEQVNLLTMHAAKGLEFSIVFIAACEDGIVPYRREGDVTDEAEERRLLYVAMTRARQVLYLTRAARRTRFGRAAAAAPSPFLAALPADLVQVIAAERGSRPPGAVQLELDLS